MYLLIFIILSILSFLGLLVLYLYIGPRILVKGIAQYLGLKDIKYSGWLYPDEYLFEARGQKDKLIVTVIFKHHVIIPEFNMELTLPVKSKLNFNLAETYSKDFLKYMDKAYLFDKLDLMYNFNIENMNVISRLSNQGIRDMILKFFSKRVVSDIYENFLVLRYKIFITYLVLFFRKKYLKTLLHDSFLFIDKLLNIDEEELLVENIESEEHVGLLTLNLMLLYTGFSPEKNSKLFEKLEDHKDRTVSIIARACMKREKISDIRFLIWEANNTTLLFSLKNILKFSISKEEKIDLLVEILKAKDYYHIYTSAINSLIKIDRQKAEGIIFEFINKEKRNTEFSSADYIFLVKIIGNNDYKSCLDFVVHQLKDPDEDLVLEAVDALIRLNEVRAVEFLLPLTRGMHPSKIKKMASEAVFKLQKNITQKDGGELSISEAGTEVGHLSINREEEDDSV
ncbi:MAG: HEAT repeat domain-containing protein [Spirochaetales bacterium]|nr:HEAT repeat domain-containing protein [Spirochaetales bacterium]